MERLIVTILRKKFVSMTYVKYLKNDIMICLKVGNNKMNKTIYHTDQILLSEYNRDKNMVNF